MSLTFTQLADALGIDGVTSVEQQWQATDDLTGVVVAKSYPLATTQAAIEADLTALFPANPTVTDDKLEPLKVLRVGSALKIIDQNGKVVLSIERDAVGNASLDVVDTGGNRRRVLTPQAGTVKMDAVATSVNVTFDQAFDEHPVVNLTPSKTLPQHDMTVTKTGFVIDFATPPAATIAFDAKGGRK